MRLMTVKAIGELQVSRQKKGDGLLADSGVAHVDAIADNTANTTFSLVMSLWFFTKASAPRL